VPYLLEPGRSSGPGCPAPPYSWTNSRPSRRRWPVGEARTLLRLADDIYLRRNEYYTPFDISPDGQRFVFARRVGSAIDDVQPLVMVMNWFEELKTKVKP